MAHGAYSGKRWTEVEALFVAATELPPGAERNLFLEKSCGEDTWLREEVLSLLRYDTAGELPLTEALQASAASLVSDDLAPGRMVGAYCIDREVGHGGMAVVYLASRADGEFRKQVAIKVIKRGMDTAAIVGRLRRERRILAALEHPCIARLLDGGTLPDGRPWIAMEYIEGIPIDDYCDRHGLGIEERCRLMGKVLDAVACAHRGLVIHRDLKPANILVTPDGDPKLLDFGIARLIDPGEDTSEEEAGAGPLTVSNAQPLTPQYASPEQMRGEPVGTAADVYSVGVILYELLAGARPSGNRESEAMRASMAAEAAGKDRRWSKRLAGDIDTILQKALRPEPDRRYLSVEQMQSDLERHFAGLPVSARPETIAYKLAKFCRRHRVPVSIAAVLAIAGIAGAIAVARAERVAQAERAKAEQRLQQMLELANTTLFNMHDSIELLPGSTGARLKIVQSTVEYLDRLNAESGGDPRVLEALAAGYLRIAKVQGSPLQPNLGDQKGAEQSYRKAARIFDTLAERGTEGPELRLRDAEFRDDYGKLIYDTGRADDAVDQYQRGIRQVETVLRLQPHDFTAQKDTVALHIDMGQAKLNTYPADVIRMDQDLLPGFDEMLREHPGDIDLLLDLAAVRNQMGTALQYRYQLSKAIESARKGAAVSEQIYALQPQDVRMQHQLMMSWGHLGDMTGSPMFLSLGDYRAGATWYGKAVGMAQKMAAADPSDREAQDNLGTALGRLGGAQQAAGQSREAVETFNRAEALLIPLLAALPKSMTLKQRISTVHLYRSRAFRDLHEARNQIDDLQKAIGECRPLMHNHASLSCPHAVWLAEDDLAVARAKSGDIDDGLREAANVLGEVQNPDNPKDSALSIYLARALAANGAVHLEAAAHRTGERKARERGAAADFYRQALAQWNLTPNNTFETAHTEMQQARAALMEAER